MIEYNLSSTFFGAFLSHGRRPCKWDGFKLCERKKERLISWERFRLKKIIKSSKYASNEVPSRGRWIIYNLTYRMSRLEHSFYYRKSDHRKIKYNVAKSLRSSRRSEPKEIYSRVLFYRCYIYTYGRCSWDSFRAIYSENDKLCA